MNAYSKAKQTARQAAASLLAIAQGKANAATKTPTDVVNSATATAAAEGWNRTPGPRT